MSIESLVEIPKLFISIAALAGVWIAYHQFTANREKIRYDLFDRRFKIYDEITNSMNQYLYGEWGNEQKELRRFYIACNEAQFILPKKVYIEINTTKEIFSQLNTVRKRIGTLENKKGNEIKLNEAKDIATELEQKLESMYPVLTERFKKVLSFEKF